MLKVVTLSISQAYERLHGLVQGGAAEDGGGGQQPQQQPHVQDPRTQVETAARGREESLEKNCRETEERTCEGKLEK